MLTDRSTSILAACLVVAGCATSSDTVVFLPPPGTQVEVTRELSAGGGARVFIQRGQVRPRRDVAVMDPHCQFISNRPRSEFDQPLVIRPGTFIVERAYRRQDYTWAAGLQLAQIGSNRNMSTIMELASPAQPDVDRLTCLRWGTPTLDGFLTVEQMRAALGDLAAMTPP